MYCLRTIPMKGYQPPRRKRKNIWVLQKKGALYRYADQQTHEKSFFTINLTFQYIHGTDILTTKTSRNEVYYMLDIRGGTQTIHFL
jgi:hypothetical protein